MLLQMNSINWVAEEHDAKIEISENQVDEFGVFRMSLPSFPSPLTANGFGYFRIAIWFPNRSDYQLYDVDMHNVPILRLTPTKSTRQTPYYFVEGPVENRIQNLFIYRRKFFISSFFKLMAWHTGGWLCRLDHAQLQPIVPIFAVSDTKKLKWVGNVGLYRDSDAFRNWVQHQTSSHYENILETGAPSLSTNLNSQTDAIPLFVAETLLEKAIANKQICPISFEELKKGQTAVTSCFHLFEQNAIQEWMKTHSKCPICKKKCSVTHC